MRSGIVLVTLLAASASASAGAVSVTSPDHAQTFAYGEVVWRELYRERTNGELAARITFSNLPYVGDTERRRDEPFDFRFPGIQFDSGRRTFFASSVRSERIPVALSRDGSFCSGIDLAPGAKIYLLKESGRVTAILTATDYPRGGMRWIERNDNFSLQNLLIALLRELKRGLD